MAGRGDARAVLQPIPGASTRRWVEYFSAHGSGDQRCADARTSESTPAKAPSTEPAPEQAEGAGAADEAGPEEGREARRRRRSPSRSRSRSRAPSAKAAEPAKGTSNPMPKESPPARARRRERRADVHRAARRAGAHRRKHGRLPDRARPPPRCARCRSSCCGTTAPSSTTTSPAPAAARSPSPTSSATRWSRRCASMPEMNVGFDVVDGKPNLITPAHINLGLAIDVKKTDGTRQLLVPSIKAAESMDFAAFWTAYEDVVRKSARRQADRRGLPGHLDLADQPRRHRHRPLGAAADEGPGRDHRRRRDGVPAGVAGRLRGRDRPQRHQQGDDAHLDLRPPGHPGCAVGRVPQARCTSCCSARTASTTRSSGRCGSPTSRSAGASDIATSHDDEISKQARILELIHAYRVRGHMMADTDPLEYRQRSHPDLEVESHGADAVGPRPRVRHRLVRRRGTSLHEAARHPRHPARLLLPHHRHRVHAHHGSRAAPLDPGARRAAAHQAAPRGAAADPAEAQPGRGLRDVPADQVRRARSGSASRVARPPSR